ncbi:MAG TPA: hypothetical protein VK790_13530 [Solirubrobacteraceae bacterium]|jgi:predicted nucleic acid-binding protein|nr:hypothetical protein [Solirubrobacteraceae bacterium]
MEVVRGVDAAAKHRPRMRPALGWLVTLMASNLVETLALDRTAAIVAGRLRAIHPAPPTGARRAGVKPEQRAGWVLDIQIAACAWVHGRAIATENSRDFEVLRDLIVRLYPDATPLTVSSLPMR